VAIPIPKSKFEQFATYPSLSESGAKVRRYGWADVASGTSPAELAMVPLELLHVDHASYQRDLRGKGKRLRMAANFNWIACGALIVARRPDGSLWIIDGQHRWEAARSRGDIPSLPCVIFDVGEIEAEAKGFIGANVDRQPLRVSERIQAQVTANDPVAIELVGLLSACGREVRAKNTGGVSAKDSAPAGACYSNLAKYRDVFLRVWPLIVELSDGAAMDSRIVSGLVTLERRLLDVRSVMEPILRRRLLVAGRQSVLRAIGEACAFYHRGGEGVYARGMLRLLNYRAKNSIRMKGEEPEEDVEAERR